MFWIENWTLGAAGICHTSHALVVSMSVPVSGRTGGSVERRATSFRLNVRLVPGRVSIGDGRLEQSR